MHEPDEANFDDVGAFHEKFGLMNVTTEGPGPCDPPGELSSATDEMLGFRVRFMSEELQEFIQGWHQDDHAQMADALIDLVYVAMGTAHLLGYPWQALWDAVQEANMAKRRASSADESKRGSALDVVKPEGWTPPDIAQVLRDHGFVL